MLSDNDIARLRNWYAEKASIKKMIEEKAPFQSKVQFMHGSHVQTGIVVAHHQYADTIRILNPKTSKEYWIHWERICGVAECPTP